MNTDPNNKQKTRAYHQATYAVVCWLAHQPFGMVSLTNDMGNHIKLAPFLLEFADDGTMQVSAYVEVINTEMFYSVVDLISAIGSIANEILENGGISEADVGKICTTIVAESIVSKYEDVLAKKK